MTVLMCLIMLAIPVALVVGMWPAVTGDNWILALLTALVIGVVLDALIVWLCGPLIALIVGPLAAVVVGVFGALRFLYGKLRTP